LLKQRPLLIAWAGSFITSSYSRVLSEKNLITPEAATFSKSYPVSYNLKYYP